MVCKACVRAHLEYHKKKYTTYRKTRRIRPTPPVPNAVNTKARAPPPPSEQPENIALSSVHINNDKAVPPKKSKTKDKSKPKDKPKVKAKDKPKDKAKVTVKIRKNKPKAMKK